MQVKGTIKKARKIFINEKTFQQVNENIFQQVNEKKFAYNNTNNNTDNILNEDNFPINEEQENFKKIWEIYPKQDNKSSAFKEYCLAFKRYKNKGYEDTLINRTFWHTVKEYADLVEKEKRESKYIKSGTTFFKNIEDMIFSIEDFKNKGDNS